MKKRRVRINAAVWFLLPYLILFIAFIVIPVVAACVLSFTNYDAVQAPKWAGFLNYINLLTQDEIEKRKAAMARDWQANPKPYPSFMLTNNSASIRQVKSRIAELSAKAETEYEGWTFEGGEVRMNRENNRRQRHLRRQVPGLPPAPACGAACAGAGGICAGTSPERRCRVGLLHHR